MPKGINVFVEDGLATIDFADKRKRGPGLAALLDNTPPELIEKMTRSGPRTLYRVPEGNARLAGLLDAPSEGTYLDRDDLGFAAALVAADPNANPGKFHHPVKTVRTQAYGNSGVITGPLRPNQPVADDVPAPPNGAKIGAADLQEKVRANTPRPADYAPQRVPEDQRVPAAQGTVAAVVDRTPQGDPGPTTVSTPSATAHLDAYPSPDWKIDRMRAYARERGIDISGAAKKTEVYSRIVAATS